ncbi:MAG: hypothetical protein Q8O57_00065, partial [Kiritimatiellota bacterium]|nr:hypothetical protein [Kiritimatiellota bacterium]
GQYRLVKKIDGEVLRLQKPWDVTPDQSSFMAVKYVYLDNLLVENETFATGGIGFYGNVVGNVVAGQRDELSPFMPAGSCNWGTADNPQNTEIGLFNECRDWVSLEPSFCWLGNIFADRDGEYTQEAYTSFGNEIRNNTFMGGGSYYSGWPDLAAPTWMGAVSLQDRWIRAPGNGGWLPLDDPRPGPPQIVYNLVCGNRIVEPGTGTGISISPRVAWSGLIRNRIEGAKKPILDMGVDTLIIP